MVEQDLFFVYPSVSHLTNFGDTGTHFAQPTSHHQVVIEYRQTETSYRFSNFSESVNIYDAYFELLPACFVKMGINMEIDAVVDLYGTKPLEKLNREFALSVRSCSNAVVTYGALLFPFPLNMKFSTTGNDFSFGKIKEFEKSSRLKSLRLLSNIQAFSFEAGKISVMAGKTYKIGYYLTHPLGIFMFLRRKLH